MTTVVPQPLAASAGHPRGSWIALASPGPGAPMTAKVERLARQLRRAVSELTRRIEVDEARFRRLFAPRLSGLGFSCTRTDLRHRAAWALAAQWLVGYGSGSLSVAASFEDAEDWFLGSLFLPRIAPTGPGLTHAFSGAAPQTIFALLPYLLDPLAPATRRDIIKNDNLAPDRLSRKTSGIYYTPADLADLMAARALTPAVRSCIDPACGSGVFLRAAATRSEHELTLVGCDIAPLAAEMCAFVLLATQLERGTPAAVSPWAAWHTLRLRLATCDSLLLRPGSELSEVQSRARVREVQRARAQLADGTTPPPAEDEPASPFLGTLFPEIAGGADVLLSNPPYAALGVHPRIHELTELYASFAQTPATARTNTYLPFVEHVWRLTHEHGRASIVVPLSLAFGSGQQLRELRRAIAARPARWKIAFFDRAPDALFGDDVKTRNTVLDYAADEAAGIETTELLRWTSRTRATFFASIAHTRAVGTNLDEVIPKLGNAAQAELYDAVRALPGCLGRAAAAIRRLPTKTAAEESGAPAVHVAGTAYNWLSCARDLGRWKDESDLSESPMTTFFFQSAEHADAAYTVLASRLTFWIWRVEGDAFHVSPRFLAGLPFDLSRLSDDVVAVLAEAGRALWASISAKPIVSVNKGRRSVGFAAYQAPGELAAVDDVLLKALGLAPLASRLDLPAWYQSLLIVDNSEAKRLALVPRPGGTPRCLKSPPNRRS